MAKALGLAEFPVGRWIRQGLSWYGVVTVPLTCLHTYSAWLLGSDLCNCLRLYGRSQEVSLVSDLTAHVKDNPDPSSLRDLDSRNHEQLRKSIVHLLKHHMEAKGEQPRDSLFVSKSPTRSQKKRLRSERKDSLSIELLTIRKRQHGPLWAPRNISLAYTKMTSSTLQVRARHRAISMGARAI